jgi:hypothetical protein
VGGNWRALFAANISIDKMKKDRVIIKINHLMTALIVCDL